MKALSLVFLSALLATSTTFAAVIHTPVSARNLLIDQGYSEYLSCVDAASGSTGGAVEIWQKGQETRVLFYLDNNKDISENKSIPTLVKAVGTKLHANVPKINELSRDGFMAVASEFYVYFTSDNKSSQITFLSNSNSLEKYKGYYLAELVKGKTQFDLSCNTIAN